MVAGNAKKFLSYREAWRRINAAKAGGFHFEVVAICESIIADRVECFLASIEHQFPMKGYLSFKQALGHWRRAVGVVKFGVYEDLITSVDRWRDSRNISVHGLAKSRRGQPTPDVVPFIESAGVAADEGIKLARAVSAWYAKELRRRKAN